MPNQTRYLEILRKQNEISEITVQMKNIEMEVKKLSPKEQERVQELYKEYFQLGTKYFKLRDEIFEIKYAYNK